MSDNAERLISELAAKLGVSAEYLWSVLVSGMRVSGGFRAGFGALLAVAACYVLRGCLKEAKRREDDGGDNIDLFMTGLFSLAGLGFAAFLLYDGMVRILAPEYAALITLMNAVRGVR